MIEKLIDGVLHPCTGYCDVKAGDIFRTIDSAGKGPLMLAKSDPIRIENPKQPDKYTWSLRACFYGE